MRAFFRFAAFGGVTLLAVILTPATPHLQGGAAPTRLAITDADDVRAVRDLDGLLNRMLRDGELRVTGQEDDPIVAGLTHERLTQYHRGIRVFGADVTRQVRGGVTTSIFGVLVPDIVVETAPGLSGDEARARLDAVADRTVVDVFETELVIVRHPETGGYHLAHQARAWSSTGLMVGFIDAHSGDVLFEYDNLQRQGHDLGCATCSVGEGLGVNGDQKKISVSVAGGAFWAEDQLRPPAIITYDMQGDWERTFDFLNGLVPIFPSDIATDGDNEWRDGANVDAHVGAGWTYDYLFERFGRRGLNGSDGAIASITHPVRRTDLFDVPPLILSLFHLNAFYCGECVPGGIVVYGEGLPPGFVLGGSRQSVDFFSGALDVVAHELAHGVTAFSSQLIYQNESGALNEAFSDFIGVGIEFFMSDTGRHPFEQPDYLIGEDVITPGGIRDLSDPLARGKPDHYSLRFTGTADNGGVHSNSLIPGHAYYLAIEGGVNRTSGQQVTGVGSGNRAEVEQVFYRAFTLMLPADATFSMARAATIQAARDQLGSGSAVEHSIAAAWNAVGVS
jgi:bacillolysin